jgi:hypothetical protein
LCTPIYSLTTGMSANSQYEGSYILLNETGFIDTQKGLNVFYFDEAIVYDDYSSSGNKLYYIGIMEDNTGKLSSCQLWINVYCI